MNDIPRRPQISYKLTNKEIQKNAKIKLSGLSWTPTAPHFRDESLVDCLEIWHFA